MSPSRSPNAAEISASAVARAATQIARLTMIGRAWESVRATIEVPPVERVSSTADQPRLESTEAST